MLYTNIQKFNDGIRLSGQTPLDDRIVIESVRDFYIGTNKSSHDLYGRAYAGLLVAEASTGELYSCVNPAPYTPGNQDTVTADNYRNYWKSVGKELYDYVHGSVDPSIDRLDGSVNILFNYNRAENIVEATDGALSVEYSYVAGKYGNHYSISAKVDDDTVRIINDKITGGKYRLTKLAESQLPEGMFSSYRLSYMGPGESSYTDLTNTQIDIPKVQVVDQVHVCKAIYNDVTKTYTETAVQGECTEEEWRAAEGDVYLHIEWDTKDDDGNPLNDKTSETYIKVSDMISIDITGLNTSVNLLEGRATRLETSTNKLETSTYRLEQRATSLEAYT